MIEAIAIGIAVLGAVLLLILFARIRQVDAELKLKKHRSKDAGLADLLNYAAVVDDGVIVGKNGSFMAAWLYQGDDNASSTEEQREMVSFRINQALAGLGSGWMVHVDAVRRPAPNYSERGVSTFTDPVSAAIDEERRRLFEGLGTMYEGHFVFAVTWFPPVLAQRKFVELMFDDDAVTPDHTARTVGLIEQFKREIRSLESRMSSAVKLTRLKGHKIATEEGREVTHDDFLSWLQFCVTGNYHPVQLPSNPMYLDAVIGGQELWGGVVPKIGRKFIQVVSLEGFPLESTPGLLSALAELPSEYRWSSRFIFMDQHESLKHLDKFRKKWKQKIRGFFDQVFNTNTGSVNQDAATMVADAEAAIAEVNSGLVAAGYFTSVVVLMDEDRERLAAAALSVEKAINRLAFAARIETINTMDAYLGSLPGHGVELVPPLGQVPIDRVVAQVGGAASEPARKRRTAVVADDLGRLMPIDQPGLLGPEALPVVNRPAIENFVTHSRLLLESWLAKSFASLTHRQDPTRPLRDLNTAYSMPWPGFPWGKPENQTELATRRRLRSRGRFRVD